MVALNLLVRLRAVLPAVRVPGRYRDAALFGLVAVLFGSSFVAIKTGLGDLPPVLFAALRFDIAALVLLGYLAFTRSVAVRPRSVADLAGIAVAATFLVALNNGLLFVGQGTTTPAVASVMYGLNPVLSPVFAWWLLGDRLSRTGLLGIAVALGGVVLIVQPSPAALSATGGPGQLLVLGAAAAIAIGSVSLQRINTGLDRTALTAWAMALGAVLLHGGSLAAGEAPTAVFGGGPVTLASLLFVAIPATAFAYTVYFGLIGRIGAVRANLVAYVVPVVAAVTGWALLGATVSPVTVAGFLVVVAGFALVERRTLERELRRRRGGDAAGSQPCATPPCDD